MLGLAREIYPQGSERGQILCKGGEGDLKPKEVERIHRNLQFRIVRKKDLIKLIDDYLERYYPEVLKKNR